MAAWLALRERWLLAGALVGLGFLVKISALYGLLAIGGLLALRAFGRGARDRRFPTGGRPSRGLGSLPASRSWGWSAYGCSTCASRPSRNPIDHVRHIVEYGASLKEPTTRSGFCTGATSAPWQWLINECQINYLSVDSAIRDGDTVVARVSSIEFRGAMNPCWRALR